MADDRFAMVPLPAIVDRRLTGEELRVLALLLAHVRQRPGDPLDGCCWPSQRTLAAALQVSRRRIRTAVRALHTKG